MRRIILLAATALAFTACDTSPDSLSDPPPGWVDGEDGSTFEDWCANVRNAFGGVNGLVKYYEDMPEAANLARAWWKAC